MGAWSRLKGLEDRDLAALSVGEAAAALRDLDVVRGATDRLEAAIVRRLAVLHDDGKAAPAADALGRSGTKSRRVVQQMERRADALGDAPRLNEALGKGKVGAEHADALAIAAGRLDEADRAALFEQDREITQLAASFPPEMFRRKLNMLVDAITADDGLDRAARQEAAVTASITRDDDTGMHRLFAKLTAEQGNRIRRALDAEVAVLAKQAEFAKLRRDQQMAHALDRLICGQGSVSAMAPAEVAVLIDYQSLLGGRHDATVAEYSDGSPVPVETVRRHACDAKIIPVVLNGNSMPLDVGRAKRLATGPQRIALRAMYRTCAIDRCDTHFDRCHIHHLAEWDDLGLTDIENLVPLCSFHHHRAHEGRWQLQLEASTRQLTITLPDGSLHSQAFPDLLAEQQHNHDAA